MLKPTAFSARPLFTHTHLVRGGSVMLQPTVFSARSLFTHTHLVRGGSLMLQPTSVAALLRSRSRRVVCTLEHQIPTSDEVGMRKAVGVPFVGNSTTHPLLTKWV